MTSSRWTWALGLTVVGAMVAPSARAADAGTDAGDDAGDAGSEAGVVCPNPAPIPAGYTPPAYVHAVPHENACSQQLIADYYTQCLDSASTAQTCAPWTNMPDAAHQACVACLVTPATASAYGPVVQTNLGNIIVSEPNLAGCVEIADPAGLSCATKLQDRTDCDDSACTAQCPVTDDPSFQLWQTCLTNADNAAGSCQAYYQATSCVSSEMPDGGVAEACFTTAANPTFEDDYNAVAPVFCLDLMAGADGGGGDGGGGSDAAGSGDGGGGGSDASVGADGGSADGGFTPVDGGPVTTPVDAGGGSDGGGGSSASKSSSGCSCRTAPASEGASALLALAGVVLLARARRRKR